MTESLTDLVGLISWLRNNSGRCNESAEEAVFGDWKVGTHKLAEVVQNKNGRHKAGHFSSLASPRGFEPLSPA